MCWHPNPIFNSITAILWLSRGFFSYLHVLQDYWWRRVDLNPFVNAWSKNQKFGKELHFEIWPFKVWHFVHPLICSHMSHKAWKSWNRHTCPAMRSFKHSQQTTPAMTCIQQAALSPMLLAPGKQFKLEAGYSPTNQTNQNHMTFGAVCSHFYGYTLCTNFHCGQTNPGIN